MQLNLGKVEQQKNEIRHQIRTLKIQMQKPCFQATELEFNTQMARVMTSRTQEQLHTFADVQVKGDFLLDYAREKCEQMEGINAKWYEVKGAFSLTQIPKEQERNHRLQQNQ